MGACCKRATRAEIKDGIIDGQAVRNAFDGHPTTITPTEARITIWRLAVERGWGPGRIGQHLSYSKSQVAAVLADIRSRP